MNRNKWNKSSFCTNGNCAEVRFRRASACSDSNCVEVGHTLESVLVRDSKDPNREPLEFTREEWRDFVKGVKAGQFDG